MKHQKLILVIFAVCFLVILTSCEKDGGTGLQTADGGDISLNMPLQKITSLGMGIDRILIEITGPTSLSSFLTISDDTTYATGNFTGLLPGGYNLSLWAFSRDNDTLATGTGQAEVKLGETTEVTIFMNLNTGGLEVTVNWGVAVFPLDNYLYVANEGAGGGGSTILKIMADGSASVVGAGFNGPSGMAIHPVTGDLYISDDCGCVYRIKPNGDGSEELCELINPNALAFDSANRLLIAECGGNITRWNPETDSTEIIATGFEYTQTIGEYNGDIYFINEGYIYRIAEDESLPVSAPASEHRFLPDAVVSGNNGGMVIDNNGNIYTNNYDGRVVKISIATGSQSVLYDKPNEIIRGLALSPSQDYLLVTRYEANKIFAINLQSLETTPVSDQTQAAGLLYGPFGMVITGTNFIPFVSPVVPE